VLDIPHDHTPDAHRRASVSDDTSCGWSSCPTGVAEDQVGSAL